MYLPDYETKLTSTFGKPIVRNPDCKAANCYGRGYTGILDDKEIVKIKNSLNQLLKAVKYQQILKWENMYNVHGAILGIQKMRSH